MWPYGTALSRRLALDQPKGAREPIPIRPASLHRRSHNSWRRFGKPRSSEPHPSVQTPADDGILLFVTKIGSCTYVAFM